MNYLQREPWLTNPDFPHPRGGPLVTDLGVPTFRNRKHQ